MRAGFFPLFQAIQGICHFEISSVDMHLAQDKTPPLLREPPTYLITEFALGDIFGVGFGAVFVTPDFSDCVAAKSSAALR